MRVQCLRSTARVIIAAYLIAAAPFVCLVFEALHGRWYLPVLAVCVSLAFSAGLKTGRYAEEVLNPAEGAGSEAQQRASRGVCFSEPAPACPLSGGAPRRSIAPSRALGAT